MYNPSRSTNVITSLHNMFIVLFSFAVSHLGYFGISLFNGLWVFVDFFEDLWRMLGHDKGSLFHESYLTFKNCIDDTVNIVSFCMLQ